VSQGIEQKQGGGKEMNLFEKHLRESAGKGLHADGIDIIQVNAGLACNQECVHCHLEASPGWKEMMQWPIMEMVLEAAQKSGCRLVDITGGAPELNPNLYRFIESIRAAGLQVQVRTNFTVLLEPGLENLPEFYRDKGVRLVGSMPCYLEENVRAQRGSGAYEKSAGVIKRLNRLGYGKNPDLVLNLVYNPGGPFLPPDQAALEADYKRELDARFGISFTSLLTIANMPIGRFGTVLRRQEKAEEYMSLLKKSFNAATVEGLMCRRQVSVGWDGTLYDCDFNLAVGWPVNHGAPEHISSFDPGVLACRRIVTGDHCFGCTAGSGSSCGGALV